MQWHKVLPTSSSMSTDSSANQLKEGRATTAEEQIQSGLEEDELLGKL